MRFHGPGAGLCKLLMAAALAGVAVQPSEPGREGRRLLRTLGQSRPAQKLLDLRRYEYGSTVIGYGAMQRHNEERAARLFRRNECHRQDSAPGEVQTS